MTPASIGRVLELVDHVVEKSAKSGIDSKPAREAREKIRAHLLKSHIKPSDVGLFIDSVNTKFPAIPRRRPQAIAMRALEECVELCLATGAHPGAILLVVGDSLANQAMKASQARGTTVFPSEVEEEWDSKEVGGEIADVLLCLRDLEYVANVDGEFHAHRKFNLLRAAEPDLYMSPSGTVRKRKSHVKVDA
jgi:hypothetical protein